MKTPLYKQIKEYILQNIKENNYQTSHRVPTEQELTILFNASRPTVNKAMNELAIDGVIERTPRKGSFVKKQLPAVSLMTLQNLEVEVKQRGSNYSYHIIYKKTIKASKSIAEKLNLRESSDVYCLKVIHLENNIPIRYDIRYVNPNILPEFIEQNFIDVTPEIYLQQQTPFDSLNNLIEAVLPNVEICEQLQINLSSPCLLISRLVTSKKLPVSYSKLYYPSERYKVCAVINNTL